MVIKKLFSFTPEEIEKISLTCKCGAKLVLKYDDPEVSACAACKNRFDGYPQQVMKNFLAFHNSLKDCKSETFQFEIEVPE